MGNPQRRERGEQTVPGQGGAAVAGGKVEAASSRLNWETRQDACTTRDRVARGPTLTPALSLGAEDFP